MSPQTPDSFDSFIRSKGLALTRTDVEGFASLQDRKATRNLIFTGVALLPIVGAVVANSRLQSGAPSSFQTLLFIFIYFAVAISIAVAAVFFLMVIFAAREAETARRALSRYDESDAAVAKANELAALEPGIALFLRSFRAEDAGYSAAEIEQYYESEAQKSLMYSQMSGGVAFVAPDPLPIRNVWALQSKAVAIVQQRMPTVLLDNVSLSSEKQTELKQGQAITIPVFGEWWPVFVEFAEKARLIVIFLESATASLSREIEFVNESGKPCVVICSEELRESVVAHARVIAYRDSESGEELGKKLEKEIANLLGV